MMASDSTLPLPIQCLDCRQVPQHTALDSLETDVLYKCNWCLLPFCLAFEAGQHVFISAGEQAVPSLPMSEYISKCFPGARIVTTWSCEC